VHKEWHTLSNGSVATTSLFSLLRISFMCEAGSLSRCAFSRFKAITLISLVSMAAEVLARAAIPN